MKKISEKSVMNQSQGKQLVEQLIRDFSDNQEYFLSEQFNETEVRNRFIDPFFKALGWEFEQNDISPEFRDVHREYSQKEGSVNKKPDYTFRIDGKLEFFAEAKAPHVRLEHKNPAHQAKRYAFSTSGKAPVVILTNFHKLKVFNALERPVHNNPLQGLLEGFDLDYLQYPKKWDFLYSHFSKEAVSAGSLDILAGKISKNTRKMDDEFLDDISRWREQMAVKLADLNQKMSEDGLNEAVQRILDRMIFLRNLEDRDLETENTLLKIAQGDEPAYPQLVKIFNGLNEFYNGLLFKPHFSENIRVDDKLLKTVIRQLCYPESPFRFDVIEPEILGHIYERFLGSEIIIENHKVDVREKPEVRKAGGVYYTPQYIVDYIVRNTVGEKIGGMTPEEIGAVKILDPACGSGSFLLGAFDILIKYHEKWYDRHRKNKDYRHDFYTMPDGKVKLTPAKKADILKKNIFGTDIDREATEVAMMSLYLKLMDNSVSKNQMELMSGHVLPDLTCNIKCGNSLIAPDFYDDDLLLTPKQERKINVFDWQQGFPEVFKQGGFDCVIGNPPYGAELMKTEQAYLEKKYKIGNTDTAALFLMQAKILLKDNGFNMYIIPKSFTFASNWAKTRDKIIKDITEIVDCSKVWKEVKLEMCICKSQKNSSTTFFDSSIRNGFDIVKTGKTDKKLCKQFNFILNGLSEKEIIAGQKIKNQEKVLNDFVKNQRGDMFQKHISKEGDYQVLGGKQIQRYYLSKTAKGKIKKEFVIDDKAFIKENSILVQRIVAHVMNPKPRIIIIATTSDALEDKNFVIVDTINQLQNISEYNSKFILGIINSNLISWYAYRFIFANAIRTMQFDNPATEKIPFPNSDLSKKKQKQHHDQLVKLVETMLELNKRRQEANQQIEKDSLQRRIDHTDKAIDNWVYKLYDLTPDEIEVVEGNA